jgi:hypothetical protein
MITGEVKVVTARNAHHVPLNGEVKTYEDVLRAIGEEPSQCIVRCDLELITDLGKAVGPGTTITAYRSQKVATAGVKGGSKGNSGV